MAHRCGHCGKVFKEHDHLIQHSNAKHSRQGAPGNSDTTPDWTGECENCGSSPIVPVTGLCGPCTWGEAETAGGNW